MLDEHLALRQAWYQRAFQRQYPGRIRFSSALQRGHRKRIIKEPLYFGARLSAESWNYGNTCLWDSVNTISGGVVCVAALVRKLDVVFPFCMSLMYKSVELCRLLLSVIFYVSYSG